MKKYFISKGSEKKGPFSIEQIKTMELTDEYSIWAEGFEDWKQITEMEELKENIIITPPPTPKQLKKNKQKTSILSALKVSGIWLIVLWLVIFFIMGGFMDDYDIESRYGYGEYKVYGSGSQIRETLIGTSLLLSAVISVIILFFTYKSRLKK
jgi:hypothetical protein